MSPRRWFGYWCVMAGVLPVVNAGAAVAEISTFDLGRNFGYVAVPAVLLGEWALGVGLLKRGHALTGARACATLAVSVAATGLAVYVMMIVGLALQHDTY
ncbi:MAG: hypothetical protein J2O48_09040 [Solirubrobacterales bacterium]|nr:hypothetical protein [Solirubrobacterales bacterium]